MVRYILLAWRSHFMAHTTTTTIASSPQRHGSSAIAVSSRPARRHCQVSLFFIFFNTASMARASTGGVSRVAAWAPLPPPPCARRSPGGAVIAYVRCRWEVAEAVSMSSVLLTHRRAALALRRGRPLAPLPPPRARLSPGAAIAFDCRRHRVDGPRVAFGRRRCLLIALKAR